jgi:hypothetical protein
VLRRPRVVRPGTALAVGIVTVLMLAGTAVVSTMTHQPLFDGLSHVFVYLCFGLIGVIVAWHQPRNPMGWVLLGVLFFFILEALAGSYVALDYRLHDGRLPLGWVAVLLGAAWAPAVVLAGLSLLLFPDGRIPSRRWRPLLWIYFGLGALWLGGAFGISADAIVRHQIRVDSSGALLALNNPAGGDAWFGVVQAVFFPVVAVCWLAWLIRQVLSYRRSSGDRRLQLKWLLSGATVFIVSGVVLVWLNNPSGLWKVVQVAALLGTLALPVSIGFGILKFRLYDIDRIISRTVGYAVVTGLLVGLYAGLVLLATQVLRFHGPVAVAVSTLAAAALFNPLRRRVQRTVDRRFNRARYDAEQTVAAFAARLQDHVELGEVRADLLDVVNAALEPAHLSVWTTPAGPRP